MTKLTESVSAPRPRVNLGLLTILSVLWPYVREKLVEQIRSIWFIVAYLLFFQTVVLGLPVVFAAMIAAGIAVVAAGLMFFMEGLRLGLMPLGESIGNVLPKKAALPIVLLFAFLVGIGATLAEPAIAVLKAAGRGVQPEDAPLLYSLLNDYTGQLVASVGTGVGVAVALGVLRFFYSWSLKLFILPLVLVLAALSLWTYSIDELRPIIGLAWDSGAVTTGPVTVPLVLALGIGVCRIVGQGDSSTDGFGIVTLASLFPVLAVLLLGTAHYTFGDYYGAENYPVQSLRAEPVTPADGSSGLPTLGFTDDELRAYERSGKLPADAQVSYRGGTVRLEDGAIVHEEARIHIVRSNTAVHPATDASWDPGSDLRELATAAAIGALQAVVPLCAFLFLTLRLLRERLEDPQMISIGILFAVLGMALFGLGIAIGLTPLGSQLGANIPSAFATVTPWGMLGQQGPLFDGISGKLLAILFGFFLGYGATLAEPALNALGDTVQNITVGAFRKSLLMHCVATGVALGIGAGVCKIAFDLPLVYLLLPPYLLLGILTWFSSEEFVNFGWDSAGVTTGPITVPLVLAMGLGIGANVPGVTDGFGILALASVGPILTVLSVGLLVTRTQRLPEAAA
ncbi:MAG: DUF1538 domain-containing protein [Pseudomonadota bacterium]